jgi:hypothetical protein
VPDVFRTTWRFGFSLLPCENDGTKTAKFTGGGKSIENTGTHPTNNAVFKKTANYGVYGVIQAGTSSRNNAVLRSQNAVPEKTAKLAPESRAFTHETAPADPQKRISPFLSPNSDRSNIENFIAQAVTHGGEIRERRFPAACAPADCGFPIGEAGKACRRCGAPWGRHGI